MTKPRFTEAQKTQALHWADSGMPVADVCRRVGISAATLRAWKKQHGQTAASDLCQRQQLEDENARLRRLVAELTADKQILQAVVRLRR